MIEDETVETIGIKDDEIVLSCIGVACTIGVVIDCTVDVREGCDACIDLVFIVDGEAVCVVEDNSNSVEGRVSGIVAIVEVACNTGDLD